MYTHQHTLSIFFFIKISILFIIDKTAKYD